MSETPGIQWGNNGSAAGTDWNHCWLSKDFEGKNKDTTQ